MRGAPPVQILCGDGGAWRLFCCGLPAWTASVLGYWVSRRLGWQPGAAASLAGCVLGALAALMWRKTRAPAQLLLVWDGQAWQLDGKPARVAVMLDLGSWMLLRCTFDGGGRDRWLPLRTRARDTGAHSARVALFAHAVEPSAAPL